jgi:uncharacterized membrane protein YhaH (DUF805 family)
MSPFDYMMTPLRKYADFSGRARRMEYWMFAVGSAGVSVVASLLDGILGISGVIGGIYGPASMLVLLGLIVPSIAVAARRLHDRDMSAWWLLIYFTGIGALVLLVIFFLEGTKGDNRFGPDPKAGG